MNVIIDFNKGITPVIILLTILFSGQWSNPTVWVYFGLHGCYGLIWVLKSRCGFGDTRFMRQIGMSEQISVAVALVLYWLPLYVIVRDDVHANLAWMGLCIMMFGVGVFFHFAADMQKTMFLEWRQWARENAPEQAKKTMPNILSTKLWTLSRNPNYFGELLIYLSFTMLPFNWLPAVWLCAMIGMVWMPGMANKDQSLSRFGKEFTEYKKRTKKFIPFVY